MARYFCHEHPDVLTLVTRAVDTRPGAVALEQTPFHPGGDMGLVEGRISRALPWLTYANIAVLSPRYMQVVGDFTVRGGIKTVVTATHRK